MNDLTESSTFYLLFFLTEWRCTNSGDLDLTERNFARKVMVFLITIIEKRLREYMSASISKDGLGDLQSSKRLFPLPQITQCIYQG